MMRPRWYAVQCQPHRERTAAVYLAGQSFDIFLPYRKRTRRHARRIEAVKAPYFPGYLFVNLDVGSQPWRDINATVGVVRLVSNGDQPAPAPRGVVEALRDACKPDGLLDWQPGFHLGQRVRVNEGPLTGLIGELNSLSDAGRISVLLDMFGGRVPVFLPRAHVVPADSSL